MGLPSFKLPNDEVDDYLSHVASAGFTQLQCDDVELNGGLRGKIHRIKSASGDVVLFTVQPFSTTTDTVVCSIQLETPKFVHWITGSASVRSMLSIAKEFTAAAEGKSGQQ
jgi:translation initiation factor IF-1